MREYTVLWLWAEAKPITSARKTVRTQFSGIGTIKPEQKQLRVRIVKKSCWRIVSDLIIAALTQNWAKAPTKNISHNKAHSVLVKQVNNI